MPVAVPTEKVPATPYDNIASRRHHSHRRMTLKVLHTKSLNEKLNIACIDPAESRFTFTGAIMVTVTTLEYQRPRSRPSKKGENSV